MARFNAEGIEGLALSFEEFSEIPDSVVEDMLMAGGEVIKKAHEDAIKRTFKRRSGHLADSPAVHLKAGGKANGFRRHVLVYPKGTHHTYHAKSRAYVPYNWGRVGKVKQTKGGGRKQATQKSVLSKSLADTATSPHSGCARPMKKRRMRVLMRSSLSMTNGSNQRACNRKE